MAGFGTNEWLVEEMYQQYLADPSSVDQAWHEFFADYRPGSPVADTATDGPVACTDGPVCRRVPATDGEAVPPRGALTSVQARAVTSKR